MFPAATRTQLLSDALILAKNGRLPYVTALELTKYMGKERSFEPWLILEKDFFYTVDDRFSTTPGYESMKVWTLF